jgi:HKD family nuclease
MQTHRLFSQPYHGQYAQQLADGLKSAKFEYFVAAIAYVTSTGVSALNNRLLSADATQWKALPKRWLVGIDWCRSEPVALDRLAKLPNSEVRVHDGKHLVTRRECYPRLPFHPKGFVLSGAEGRSLLLGSGNLSRNGMLRGHELGVMSVVKKPLTASDAELWEQIGEILAWVDSLWSKATPYSKIAQRYSEICAEAKQLASPAITDDDSSTSALVDQHSISADRLRKLRVAQRFWIEAGNLHANRGPGRAGNQLMLQRMSRVFFGFLAEDLPKDTTIGSLAIQYGNFVRPDCSLRFSNNSMDVLTLPLPGEEGPSSYDKEVILFEKQPSGVFKLSLLTAKQYVSIAKKSAAADCVFEMSSGRKFGVF